MDPLNVEIAVIVCVCEGIGHREIMRRVETGTNTVQELSDECGAGKSCGQCVRMLRQLIDVSKGVEITEVDPRLQVCAK